MRQAVKNSCKNFAKSFAKLLPALAAIVGPDMGVAQQVEPCSSDLFPVQPAMAVIQDQRSFAQGAVKLFLLDLGQPEAGNLYLALVSPPYDVAGNPQCRLVSWGENRGFAQLDFAALDSTYDPAQGLTLSLPGLFVLPEQGFSNSILMHLTINQATGAITTDAVLGLE